VISIKVSQIKNIDTLISQVQSTIHNNPGGHYQHRLHVILLVLKFRNIQYAVDLYQEPKRTIQYWMQQFLKYGVEGLKDEKRPGRPSQLTKSQKQALKRAIEQTPRDLGYEQNDWDGKLLSHHIAEVYHINLKVRRCQYLFHELGFTLQKPRPVCTGDLRLKEEFKKNKKDH